MAYTPNEWECGEVVTAEKLNTIERGIAEVNSEYVPTEWQCGDVITAEKMNKIEQGIADAECGGDCDFSFATVTLQAITNKMEGSLYQIISIGGVDMVSNDDVIHYVGSGAEVYPNVILYEGRGYIWLENDPSQVTLSGDVTYDEDLQMYVVTGDCTLTT